MLRRRLLFTVAFAVVLVCMLAVVVVNLFLGRRLALPPHQRVQIVSLPQGWDSYSADWFHHASQGGALEVVIPYKWFISLEWPRLSLFEQPLLVAPECIERFGFLSSPEGPGNPDGLPIGFTRTPSFKNPISGRWEDVIGFTCAACHTGQINYRGKGLRIEGGAALTELDKFRTALGLALVLTSYDPLRFRRFAQRVLGQGATREQRSQLREGVRRLVHEGAQMRARAERHQLYPITEGFGRLDALGRIGNFVFGTELSEVNLLPADAPVNYPHIWNAPWFDWVQYNGSIRQPMTRNVGEAMGVFAGVSFDPNSGRLFDSTVDVANLHKMESMLRGEGRVFEPGREPQIPGLASPRWAEDVLGPIDRAKASRGAQLYVQNCSRCHLPAPNTPDFYSPAYWTDPDQYGNRYLKLRMINLYDIGTDPATAVNWYKAVVNLQSLGQTLRADINKRLDSYLAPPSGGSLTPAAVALPLLVEKVTQRRYDALGLSAAQRAEWDGQRPNDVRAPLAYKARPLNGVWATPPFLHNGSVPNLYEVLLPAERREKTFYLGSKEYDPLRLGYRTERVPGAFLLDTSVPGNRNTGHEFRGTPGAWRSLGPGVIGHELTEDERWALIEYLKTL